MALAGRRIDAEGASPPRFPLAHVGAVRARLLALLEAEAVGTLVASAACGADLVALETALALGLRCRVVLPFGVERFRETSVVDRPGDWGPVYDRVIARVQAAGELVVVEEAAASDTELFLRANVDIVRNAESLGEEKRLAVTVWEGVKRDGSDATDRFRLLAEAAGFELRTVSTAG